MLSKITSISMMLLAAMTSVVSAAPPVNYQLTWQDNFNGDHLDLSRWTPLEYRRDDAQLTANAATVKAGTLTITTYTMDGKNYTGFLSTQGKFETTYGYFEARIRFNTAPGQWSAFWLQSPTMGKPVGDPQTAGTEIDIVEHRAMDGKSTNLSNVMAMNLHWDGYGKDHKHAGALGGPSAGFPPLQGHWHTYAFLWTPESYTFYLDDVKQWTTTMAASHRSEFIRLTCEVRNKSWAGNIPAGGFGAPADSKAKMEVDWVRVWQPRR